MRWVAVLTSLMTCLCLAADWPGFRGPNADGTSDEHGLPVRFSATENLVWKTPLPGPGASSPVVSGDHIFVTCWSGYGAGDKPADLVKLRRHLVSLDRTSGKILWQAERPAPQPETEWGMAISQHGYATGTPVTDGQRVYVFFGKGGVLAYDFAGKELWHTEVGSMRDGFGSGSSPVLYRNLVLVNASVECGRLVALDKQSGKVVWRAPFYGDCWTTPVVVSIPGGNAEVVLYIPSYLVAFDPENGKELWRCECPGPDYVSATPVVRGDVLYLMGAGKAGRLFQAVRAGGRGDVTSSHVIWKQKVGASYCSPVLVGDQLYFFSGRACCLRADTGAVVFQEPLDGLGTEYASPVAADGKIFLFTRRGRAHVLAARNRLEQLAVNDLGEPDGFTASPAVSHGQLLVRSSRFLYCFGEKK